MIGFIPAFALAVASLCQADGVRTDIARLTGVIGGQQDAECAFQVTADVIYRIDHDSGVMLLLADDAHQVLAHFNPAKSDIRCQPGDRIRAAGIIHPTSPAGHRLIMTNATTVGRALARTFDDRRLSEILDGTCDWCPAHISGMVRNAVLSETNPSWVYLMLGGDDGSLYISAPRHGHPLSEFEDLIGRRIRARGYAVPFDGSVRHYQGRIFHCDGIGSLQPADPHPKDPFDVPDVSSIANRRPDAIAALGLHRAAGTVLAAWQRRRILLKASDGRILRVEFQGRGLPQTGRHVVVTGLPESDIFHINLAHAQWKPSGEPPEPRPEARPVAVTDIFRRGGGDAIDISWHGRRAQLTGIVRKVPEDVRRTGILSLECDDHIVSVDFGDQPVPDALPPTGATVTVTGICVLDAPNWQSNLALPQIGGLSLVLDAPDGLKTLAMPAWWTPTRLFSVIGILLALLLAIVTWNISLRHLVERRSRALLREQIKRVQSSLRVAERTRLSVELHDSLAQSLAGVAMELETARTSEAADSGRPNVHLDIAARSLKSCRNELRNCLWDLRSEALDEPNMTRAIVRTLKPQVDHARLQVRFNVPRARLSDTTAHAILRIVRELVVNALRHGRAQTVRVAGSMDASQLMFSVRDDGCGFEPDRRPGMDSGHFGLQGVEERVGRIGGNVRIESAPGRGTRVSITLPSHMLTQG